MAGRGDAPTEGRVVRTGSGGRRVLPFVTVGRYAATGKRFVDEVANAG